VTKPPSTGIKVAISIKQFEPAKMEADQMAIPIINPRGPALVSGPPMDTNSAAPIATHKDLIHTIASGTYLQK